MPQEHSRVYNLLVHGEQPTSLDLSDYATILLKVGPEEQEFYAPREILCKHSPYFRAALKGQFREAVEGVMTLPDTLPKTFEGVMEWLRTERFSSAPLVFIPCEGQDEVPSTDSGWECGNTSEWLGPSPLDYNARKVSVNAYSAELEKERERGKVDWSSSQLQTWLSHALNVYIFADTYDVPALRTAVLIQLQSYDRLRDTYGRIIDLHIVHKAFDNLPASSPLCRYLISRFGFDWWPLSLEVVEDLPREFLAGIAFNALSELAKRYGHSENLETKPHESWCTFHEHASQDEKVECQIRRLRERTIGDAREGRLKDSRLP